MQLYRAFPLDLQFDLATLLDLLLVHRLRLLRVLRLWLQGVCVLRLLAPILRLFRALLLLVTALLSGYIAGTLLLGTHAQLLLVHPLALLVVSVGLV